MIILHVHIRVKPECVEAFRAATLANAGASVREPLVARFDVAQQEGDPTRFVLVEAYRSPEGHAAHRETAHYKAWRTAVEPMMAEERRAARYASLFPPDSGW
jgi:(4S)-4-hydroxy-5-phosphonooxypentane-2,3-dione isomerase